MTLKLNFNEPIPKNQRNTVINCFRDMGFSYDRISQPGEYALLRFYGRLPTVCGSSDLDLISVNVDSSVNVDQFKDVDYLEIFIHVERN